MVNTHNVVAEETEITLNLRIKITNATTYSELSEEDLKKHIEQAKIDLKQVLLNKVKDEYTSEELTNGVYYNYEVLENF